MRIRLLFRIALILTVSVCGTGAAYFYSLDVLQKREATTIERWAGQLGTQAEGLFFEGRQNGKADPLDWAIRILSQRPEEQTGRIRRWIKNPSDPDQRLEWLSERGLYRYRHLIDLTEGQGIEAEIPVTPIFFLGLSSQLQEDIALGVVGFSVWAFLYGLFFGIPNLFSDQKKHREKGQSELSQENEPHLEPSVAGLPSQSLSWAEKEQETLRVLGRHMRDMIKEAKNQAVAAGKSRKSTLSLRSSVHTGLNQTRKLKKLHDQISQWMIEAEVMSLNLSLEVSHGIENPEEFSIKADRLCTLAQQLSREVQQMRDRLERLERDLEPVATDADMAFHAYEEVFQASGNLDASIQGATETLIEKARSIQSFTEELKKRQSA